jgi:hypothetical protein
MMQGCQIFHDTKYQNGAKFTKLPPKLQNGLKLYVPNGRNIFLLDIEYTKLFQSKDLQKISHIVIFGLKIYHLATLER